MTSNIQHLHIMYVQLTTLRDRYSTYFSIRLSRWGRRRLPWRRPRLMSAGTVVNIAPPITLGSGAIVIRPWSFEAPIILSIHVRVKRICKKNNYISFTFSFSGNVQVKPEIWNLSSPPRYQSSIPVKQKLIFLFPSSKYSIPDSPTSSGSNKLSDVTNLSPPS